MRRKTQVSPDEVKENDPEKQAPEEKPDTVDQEDNAPTGSEATANEPDQEETGIESNVVIGNPDVFRLLCQEKDDSLGRIKTISVGNVSGGCLVQVSTQQRNPDGTYAVAEAITYVPGNYIKTDPMTGLPKIRG